MTELQPSQEKVQFASTRRGVDSNRLQLVYEGWEAEDQAGHDWARDAWTEIQIHSNYDGYAG